MRIWLAYILLASVISENVAQSQVDLLQQQVEQLMVQVEQMQALINGESKYIFIRHTVVV